MIVSKLDSMRLFVSLLNGFVAAAVSPSTLLFEVLGVPIEPRTVYQ